MQFCLLQMQLAIRKWHENSCDSMLITVPTVTAFIELKKYAIMEILSIGVNVLLLLYYVIKVAREIEKSRVKLLIK